MARKIGVLGMAVVQRKLHGDKIVGVERRLRTELCRLTTTLWPYVGRYITELDPHLGQLTVEVET